ncbi:MAG: hypothetical protein HY235_10245, partial [Acidobacteria bacterium]|nr:hypothetical protein [Acidobacteriota bacterium]
YVLGGYLGKQDPVSVWTIRVLVPKGAPAVKPAFAPGRDAWLSVLPAGTPPSRLWLKEVARILLESNARRMSKEWEDGLLDFLSMIDATGPKFMLGHPPPSAERTRGWARVHYFATNPEYGSRFRVLLNNLQQGAGEQVAFRNSVGQAKDVLEKEIDRYFAAGQFAPVSTSGRAVSERDFSMRPVETARVTASLADSSGNPRLSPAGTLEGAEGLGLAAAAQQRKQEALEWLKQAVAAGSKSPRVHLEYGRLVQDVEAKRNAYVEAGKRNPRWAEPYIALAGLEATPERQAFYLKTAAALDPRNSALWQRLGRAQFEAKEFAEASKSWFAAELAAATDAERALAGQARRQFEEERQEREAAERKRIADERQRELDRLKEEALNSIRTAEARANRDHTPPDPGRKVEAWWDDKQPSQRISGRLVQVDCLGTMARIHIQSAEGKPAALLIRDSAQIVILGGGQASFGCGPQKPPRSVTLEFKPRPDSKLATAGDVVLVEFR